MHANGSFAKQVAASTVHKACKSSGDTSQDWRSVTILDRGPRFEGILGLETTVEHVQRVMVRVRRWVWRQQC